ncbi:MAG: hypothetical protein ACREC4_01245, partial [Methylocella sp.]
MNKVFVREFRLASSGEEGLLPYLNEHGAFLGRGTPLLARDGDGNFAPLPQRDLEIVLSAGFGVAVDLGARMGGLATLAKAMNEGDYALASIALAHLQFPALPDKGACARMQKAAAMLKRGASAAGVLKQFLSRGELAKDNPYHLGPGVGGGQFTTADMDGVSSGVADSQGYATKLSADEILDQAQDTTKTPGWLQPK